MASPSLLAVTTPGGSLLVVGAAFKSIDRFARRWSVASISLLLLAGLFGGLLMTGATK